MNGSNVVLARTVQSAQKLGPAVPFTRLVVTNHDTRHKLGESGHKCSHANSVARP